MLCLCISMVSSMGPSASDGLWFSEIMQTYHDMYKPTQPINEMKRLTNLNQELITLKKQNQNTMKMMRTQLAEMSRILHSDTISTS